MKISVIVPVYKAEKYIEECLLSLLSQTMIDDMEIIAVDDHGNDCSMAIVEGLKNNHEKGSHIVTVATVQNSGAWAARNLGMEIANGEYIGFCDADDWVEKEMYEKLYNEAQSTQSDWSFCNGQKVFEDNRTHKLKQYTFKSTDFDENTRKKMMTQGVAYFWTAIYKSSFLKGYNICFPNGKFSEDSYFWWVATVLSERVGCLDYNGYNYRIQPNSVSKRPDAQKAQIKQEIYSKLIAYFKETGYYERYQEELDFLYIKKGYLIPLMIEAINKTAPDLKQIDNKRKSDKINLWRNRYLYRDLKTIVLAVAFRCFPKTICALLRSKYETDIF
ncbi:MAG: glycosyltransferase [Paludibacteraceae bacterium]|nr:glycosyltransferase [Paludibacteraceae bacterium]